MLPAQAYGTRVCAPSFADVDIHQTPLGIYPVALRMGHVMHRVSVPDTPQQAMLAPGFVYIAPQGKVVPPGGPLLMAAEGSTIHLTRCGP